MIRTVAAIGLALALTGCTTNGPPAGLRWYVISQLNDFYTDPEDPTNRPPLVANPPTDAVRKVDVDADGVDDWIVAWPDSSQFCGTGGCRYTVYLTKGQNLARIFDRQSLGPLDVTTVDGEARFEGRFHPSFCSYLRDNCRLAWGLDAATRKLVPRASANGDRHAVRGEQAAIDPIWDEPL